MTLSCFASFSSKLFQQTDCAEGPRRKKYIFGHQGVEIWLLLEDGNMEWGVDMEPGFLLLNYKSGYFVKMAVSFHHFSVHSLGLV